MSPIEHVNRGHGILLSHSRDQQWRIQDFPQGDVDLRRWCISVKMYVKTKEF